MNGVDSCMFADLPAICKRDDAYMQRVGPGTAASGGNTTVHAGGGARAGPSDEMNGSIHPMRGTDDAKRRLTLTGAARGVEVPSLNTPA